MSFVIDDTVVMPVLSVVAPLGARCAGVTVVAGTDTARVVFESHSEVW